MFTASRGRRDGRTAVSSFRGRCISYTAIPAWPARYYHEIAGHLETYKAQSKGFVVRPVGLGDWLAPDMSTPKGVDRHRALRPVRGGHGGNGSCLGQGAGCGGLRGLAPVRSRGFSEEVHRSGRNHRKRLARRIRAGAAYDLLEPEQARQAADKLIAAIEKRDGHLSTGMVTTHLLLPALSKAGRTDAAYRLLARPPSRHGATFFKWALPACGNAGTPRRRRAFMRMA